MNTSSRLVRPFTMLGIVGLLGIWVAWVGLATAQDSARALPIELDDLAAREVPDTGSRSGDELRGLMIEAAPADVQRGAVVFDENCSVCHGDTGLGLEEARLSFPTDHRACERCHRPGNERIMSFETMLERQHSLFDVGVPPALRGPTALAAFASSDEALFAYVRATMPRYQPGRLSDEDYRDVVAFLRWIAPVGNGQLARQ